MMMGSAGAIDAVDGVLSDGSVLPLLRMDARRGGAGRGILLFLHGLGEHALCHEAWLARFAAAGFDVVAPDLRGHGHWPGRPGAVASYARMQQDVSELIAYLRRGSSAPLIVYGHSMGGNLALATLRGLAEPPERLVLSSPWLRLSHRPAWLKLTVGRMLVHLVPAMTMPSGLKDDQLARPPEVAAQYRDDPLTHRRISLGIYYGAMQVGRELLREGMAVIPPTLLLHGDQDGVTSVGGSEALAARCGGRVELRVMPGGAHDLHYGAGAGEVFEVVEGWLTREGLRDEG